MNAKTVFVIGAGAMGAGIAQVVATGGFKVYLNDVTMDRVARGQKQITNNINRNVTKGKMTPEEGTAILGRLTYTDSYDKVAEADVVIEAIFENLDAKKAIFQKIGPMAKEGALLATNTSSLSLTAIGSVVPHPERFIGIHFFNPAPVMKLVELVVGLKTSPETIADAMAFGKKLGKDPVVSKDSPGFLVNRCLVVMLNEAICLYSEGVGSAEDIDKGMMLGCNHPMGPLTLADMVGLDIVSAVMECFYTGFADSKYRPALLLRKMVDAGMLGIKTGQGFYKYDANGKKVK